MQGKTERIVLDINITGAKQLSRSTLKVTYITVDPASPTSSDGIQAHAQHNKVEDESSKMRRKGNPSSQQPETSGRRSFPAQWAAGDELNRGFQYLRCSF